ncbi:MAG: ABC transporter ATP-binding protein [bacterium]
MAEVVLQASDVSHSYEQGHPILQDIDFSLSRGQSVAVQGPSGVGKTTLLEILGTMRSPSEGQVLLAGEEVYKLPLGARARLRGRKLGFVFQESLLLPDLTVWENCRLAVVLSGCRWGKEKIWQRFKELLESLGLSTARADSLPGQLSTGERQRVAVVRSLMHNPVLLIADEPTGNLDSGSSEKLMDLLLPLVEEEEAALLVATHDPVLAESLGSVYEIQKWSGPRYRPPAES